MGARNWGVCRVSVVGLTLEVCMSRPRFKRLPVELRRQVIEGARLGMSTRQISREYSVGLGSIQRVLRPLGGVIREELVEVLGGRLSIDDRVEIYIARAAGETLEAIGVGIGRHKSTVCRELQRAGEGRSYQPMSAHRQAIAESKRPKVTKLAANPILLERVTAGLEQLWSPQQIADVLRVVFGDDPSMHISHETIYKSLFVQGRGELRRELAQCLRTGRTIRRHHNRSSSIGQIPEMVMISDRPAEIEDRAVPGHWEGDLIIGRNNKSAVGTLVERSTRYLILLHLPNGRSAAAVRDAMTTAIAALPASLCRSITWDQGKEMSEHATFTVDTGIDVYFCEPHSPWQRGSNENTNGLLRQYMPKGTDLSLHTADDLQRCADSLNPRPRKTLGLQTPATQLNALLVASTG